MSQNVPKKEQAGLHRGPRNLAFHVVGHVGLHDFVGGARVAVEAGEHGAEVGFGHSMPAVEVGTIVDTEVAEEIAE